MKPVNNYELAAAMKMAPVVQGLKDALQASDNALKASQREVAQLHFENDEQLRILLEVAQTYKDLQTEYAEKALYFLQQKVALLERAESAERKLSEAGL